MCVRCRTRQAERGRALCNVCRGDLEIQTACEREQANAQMIAERQAVTMRAQAPKRKRSEWREAV